MGSPAPATPRAHLDYTARRDAVMAGFDPDTPVAGYYRMKLRSGGLLVGVRIWHGAPADPVTGEELDRSPRWQADVNGEPFDIERVWPRCAGDPIDAAEYRHLSRLQAWGRDNDPDGGIADPTRPLDPLSTPTMF